MDKFNTGFCLENDDTLIHLNCFPLIFADTTNLFTHTIQDTAVQLGRFIFLFLASNFVLLNAVWV